MSATPAVIGYCPLPALPGAFSTALPALPAALPAALPEPSPGGGGVGASAPTAAGNAGPSSGPSLPLASSGYSATHFAISSRPQASTPLAGGAILQFDARMKTARQ